MLSGRNSFLGFRTGILTFSIVLFAALLLFLGGADDEAAAEDVAFYQAGGFGGAYKNTHYDGEYLYTTHYQGMSIFDVSDPDDPEEIGFCLTTGFAYGLWVDGDHAYVGNGYESLLVIDISDKENPHIVGEAPNEWFASGVFVDGDYAYVADGYFQAQDQGGLLIYDISDKEHPSREGKLSTSQGGPNEVVVEGDYAYVANGQDGLLIADVSNKQMPMRVGSYGTSYACDLAIRDNYAYLADRTGGLVVIDHSIKQFPMPVGSYDTDGEAWGIELVGDYAYVADFDNGLVVIDVSNPNFPVQVGRLDTANLAMKVTIVGDRAFIADNTNGLVVADVSVPANPQETGHFETAGMVMDLELAGAYVYVCDNDRLFILEQSDINYPKHVGFYQATGNGEGEGVHAAVDGDYCYLANGEAGLVVLDVSDPTDPRQVGGHDTDDLALDVFVDGDYAYVVDGENGLVIMDISNPTLPQQVGHYDTNDIARRIVVRDGLAYVGDRFEDLQIIDVSNPMSPTFVGNWTSEDGHVNGVALSGDHAYLSAGSAGLRIIDISNPANPVEVGDYPTDGWAMLGVNVIGHHALLGDNLNGVVIVDVSDPSDPQLAFHYDTPDASSVIEVAGNYAYVCDRYNGLVIGEVTGLAGGTPRAVIEEMLPNPAYTDTEVSFKGRGSGGSGEFDRYVWRSHQDGELYDGPEDQFSHRGFTSGNHTIYFKLRDSEGTWSYEERGLLTIGTRPVVTVESPENNSQVSETVNITGTARDEDGDHTIEKVEVAIDGGGWETLDNTTEWYFEWNTNDTSNGDHTLSFRAEDDIDHSHEVVWVLDVMNEGGNIIPEVEIEAPEDGDELSDLVTIEGTATDENGDETIKKVEISIDGEDWEEAEGTESWKFEWDTTTIEDGEHTITSRAYDGEEYSEEIEITVNVLNVQSENLKPFVTIDQPVEGGEFSGTIQLSGTAGDLDGAVEKVELSVDGGGWEEVEGTDSWSYQLDTTKLEDGEHTLAVKAFDGERYSDEENLTITVKNAGGSEDSGDDDDFEIAGMNGYQVVGGSVGALAVLGLAAVVLLKKKGKESCPDCGGELEYVEDYDSWYCYDCEEYK